jgi:hypothetical protein
LQLSSLQDDAAHVTVPSASIENAAAADASPANKEETKEGASTVLELSSLQDDAVHVTVPSASIENAAAADASPASKQKEETKEGASAVLEVCVSPCVLH